MKIKESIKGFALLQLGILIILLGLIVAFAIPKLGFKVAKEKRVDTKGIIENDIDAILGFAAVNDRLPTVAEFSALARNPKDIWGNDLVYWPDDNLDNPSSTICGRTTTDTTVYKCGTDDTCASPDTDADVAFVIFSGGENLNLQTFVSVTGASATIQTYTQGLLGIDDYAVGLSRPEEYKDIIRWMSLNELKIKIGCSGSLANLRIVNSSLPSGTIGTAYAVNVLAEGGVTMADGGDSDSAEDYEWCVEGNLPPGLGYDCDGSLSVSTACTLTGGSWKQCTYLEISGTPTTEWNAALPIAVRDDDGNIAYKVFGLQVVPETLLNVCDAYRVWNAIGAIKSFLITGNACITNVADGDEITTSPSVTLNATEDIRQYQQHNSCGNLKLTATYRQAILGDINEDCCIKFTDYAPPDYVIFVDRDCSGGGGPDDDDGDGYTTDTDCDDSDATVNPGADDSDCNGIDNDCDGTDDDDYVITATSCGTGVCESSGQLECQSGSQVDTCSSGSPAESPESSCSDGLDNDCDGDTDGADSDCGAVDVCAGSGVDVVNHTGSKKGFDPNGAGCEAWNKNNTKTVFTSDSIDIYDTNDCGDVLLCTKPYSDFRAAADDDCEVELTGSCTLGDN